MFRLAFTWLALMSCINLFAQSNLEKSLVHDYQTDGLVLWTRGYDNSDINDPQPFPDYIGAKSYGIDVAFIAIGSCPKEESYEAKFTRLSDNRVEIEMINKGGDVCSGPEQTFIFRKLVFAPAGIFLDLGEKIVSPVRHDGFIGLF